MGNKLSSTSSPSGSSVSGKGRGKKIPFSIKKKASTPFFSTPPPAAIATDLTLPMSDFDLAVYALYTRAVCIAELSKVRNELKANTGGDSLLQDCLIVAILEVLNGEKQPQQRPGVCLLPGQTLALTKRDVPVKLRSVFQLAERVKQILQAAAKERRLLQRANLRESSQSGTSTLKSTSMTITTPFTFAELRKAVFLSGSEQAKVQSSTIQELLSLTGLLVTQFFNVRNHCGIQRAAMRLLRTSLVLSGQKEISPNASTVAVRPVDATTFGVAWINVCPIHDSVSSVLMKIRRTSQVDSHVDITLTDLTGEIIEDVLVFASNENENENEKTIVVHAVGGDKTGTTSQFLSRMLQDGNDEELQMEKKIDRGSSVSSISSSTATSSTANIPLVPGQFIMGNVKDVQQLGLHKAANKWIKEYGDIVKVYFLGQEAYVVRRASFAKTILSKQNKLAPFTHVGGGSNGLFFADREMHTNLRKTLNPCFYSSNIDMLYSDLIETVGEFVDSIKYRGVDRGEVVDLWQWSVRLFYDGMAKAGLGCSKEAVTLSNIRDYGANAQYPKILTLFEEILELEKTRQVVAGGPTPWWNSLPTPSNQRYHARVSEMYKEAGRFVRHRHKIRKEEQGDDKRKYFLDACLDAFPNDDTNGFISARAQVLNFFRAGTDTTAASLCWTIIELSQHPAIYRKLMEEIDQHHSSDNDHPPSLGQLHHQMPYLDALLKEVMRHHPPANILIRGIDEKELILNTNENEIGYDGKSYVLPIGARVMIDIIGLHMDQRYWKNPKIFDPNRFLISCTDSEKIESGSYIPFGGGPRTCIGNIFGLLEVKLALVQLYRKYRFESIGEEITVKNGEEQKPATGARLKMILRGKKTGNSNFSNETKDVQQKPLLPIQPRELKRGLWSLFGSNQSTCESYCKKIKNSWILRKKNEETSHCRCCSLNEIDIINELINPFKSPSLLLICTSTYNGQPPDNAKEFVSSLHKLVEKYSENNQLHRKVDDELKEYDELKDNLLPLSHITYSIFGSGNSNWGSTFQAIPIEINSLLSKLGAKSIYPLQAADASEGPSICKESFEFWLNGVWKTLGIMQVKNTEEKEEKEENEQSQSIKQPFRCIYSNKKKKELSSLRTRSQALSFSDLHTFTNVGIQRLTTNLPNVQEVCHVELSSSSSFNYESGDHLEIGATQDNELINNLCLRIGLNPLSYVTLSKVENDCNGSIPSGCEYNIQYLVHDLLIGRDLSIRQSTFRKLLKECSMNTENRMLMNKYINMKPQDYRENIQKKLLTFIDVLNLLPSLSITLETILIVTEPLARRYYSISSCPFEQNISLTVGVVNEQRSNDKLDNYHGISSWPLTRISNINTIFKARIVKSTFRLPIDITIPVIFCCGGTGIAPFRAFLLEREKQYDLYTTHQQTNIGKTVLYFGYRNDHHFLYKNLISRLVKKGVVDLRIAISRPNDQNISKMYVQNRMKLDSAELYSLIVNANANVYVCGSVHKIGRGVSNVLIDILKTNSNRTKQECEDYFYEAESDGRYHRDVWG